jgi:hypothetical protein
LQPTAGQVFADMGANRNHMTIAEVVVVVIVYAKRGRFTLFNFLNHVNAKRKIASFLYGG